MILRAFFALILSSTMLTMVFTVILIKSKDHVYEDYIPIISPEQAYAPFPVSVNPKEKYIQENPTLNDFLASTVYEEGDITDGWWNKLVAVFYRYDWYQNLASSVSRIVVIRSGERKEEIIKNIGDVIGWNKAERNEFTTLIDENYPAISDGKIFPGRYLVHKSATPSDVHELLTNAYQLNILNHYTDEVESRVPLTEALIIASLLEREASDFKNMREISGVIWNRLFIDMPLQLDATLQYVKGSNPYISSWWPKVLSQDKFLNSPYNTYKNKGLPPGPIANVSTEAIIAALNPTKTTCYYYFHHRRQYYCSETYEGHVGKLRQFYGRGS